MQGSRDLRDKVVVIAGDLRAPNLRSLARRAELGSDEDACRVGLVNPLQNPACSDGTVWVFPKPR